MIHFISNQTKLGSEIDAFVNKATVQDVYDYFRNKPEIQVDTETEGFDPYEDNVLLLQFGDFDNQFVIDTSTVNILNFKDLLEKKDKLYLLQNAKFDLRFFYHQGIWVPRVYDTFLAECILTTGLKNRQLALDALASKYANGKLNKAVRGEIHRGLSVRVINYAAEDVKYLSKIKTGQMAHLVDYGLARREDVNDKYTVLGLENRVVRAFAHMEYNGVGIDQDQWKETSAEIEQEFGYQRDKLDDLVIQSDRLGKFVPSYSQGDLFGFEKRKVTINYNSPQQKVQLLNLLGINVDSSADPILQKYQDRHPIVKELRELNKLSKLSSSFGYSLLEEAYKPQTGRFHPEYWQILQTGRISVKQPNTNQIPARGKFGPLIRKAFVGRPGWKIVGGDYAAMELRELAEFSQDPLWLKIFNEGLDLHTVLCAETFNIPESEVRNPYPKNPAITYRDIQKTINYGLAYGMSSKKLASTMNVPKEEAQKVIDGFFAKVPYVDQKLSKFGKFAMDKGYIKTAPPYGRIRWFPGHEKAWATQDSYTLGKIERAGMNTPIQGTNADITKLAMVNAFEDIEENNYPANIVLSVYDELQTEAEDSFAEEWKIRLEKHLVDAAQIIITSVPVIAECAITDHWDH